MQKRTRCGISWDDCNSTKSKDRSVQSKATWSVSRVRSIEVKSTYRVTQDQIPDSRQLPNHENKMPVCPKEMQPRQGGHEWTRPAAYPYIPGRQTRRSLAGLRAQTDSRDETKRVGSSSVVSLWTCGPQLVPFYSLLLLLSMWAHSMPKQAPFLPPQASKMWYCKEEVSWNV